MQRDLDFNDTLMHVSGNILKLEVSGQVKPYVEVSYIVPGQLAESGEQLAKGRDAQSDGQRASTVNGHDQGGQQ